MARRRRASFTLTVKNQNGKHLMSFQAGSWKKLAGWYSQTMRQNRHLKTFNVVTRGNHATVTVARA